MDTARWHQIQAIFEQALEHPVDQRPVYLADACSGDDGLRAEVASLLSAAEGAESFFEDLAGRVGMPFFSVLRPEEAPVSARDGDQIGPYRVIREIGRGGMGAVYLAERADEQFQQRVALKLVKRGMDTDAVLQRFLRERQILALLQHPHIARLYDGGVTEEGLPYFAMEYIEGTPLPTYCDTRHLDIDARLRLFVDVGRAVQYAHQNLIVHRDLKPSNILVTDPGSPDHVRGRLNPGQAQVKLLDFGIAKLLGDDHDAPTLLTQVGMRLMTPAYAAPEQVKAEPVTTATDIYTLGLLLYELLTGHRPYRVKDPTPEALAQAVLEHAPIRPSTAVHRTETIIHQDGTTETVTPERICQARATQTDRLRRRLSGDLDMICLTALRKEPERRYASAAAFVEDIERHLAGLPVLARNDAPGYRLRKFVGRHKLIVSASLLIFAALVTGLTVALWQANVASLEARKAEEVKTFLVDMFNVSDPNVAKGETLTARDLLDRGAARIDSTLVAQPEVQAEIMDVIGGLYHTLGLYDRSEDLLQDALLLRRDLKGTAHPDVAASLNVLGNLLREKGEYDRAEPLLREALAIQRKESNAPSREVAGTLNNLGRLLTEKGDYRAAEPVLREVVNMRRRLLGDEHIDVANSLNELAQVLKFDGNFTAAEPLYDEALAMQRKLLGRDHLFVATTTENLAMLFARQGNYDEAAPLLLEALAIRQKLLGEAHPDVAITVSNLGSLYYVQGNYAEAEVRYRKALAMHRELLGATNPRVATDMNNLAVVLKAQGAYDEAERLQRTTLAMQQSLYGAEHPDVANSLHNLANVFYEKEALSEAEQFYREALAMRRRLLAPEHANIGMSLFGLGRVWTDQQRYSDAEPVLRDAVRIFLAAFGDTNGRTAEARQTLGRCLTATGRYPEAEPFLQESHAFFQEEHGEEHPSTQRSRAALADLYRAWGKPDQAATYQEP